MEGSNKPLEALEDIRQLMQKSSRFIGLSGWSGVAAGICALIGAWTAKRKIETHVLEDRSVYFHVKEKGLFTTGDFSLTNEVFAVAVITFIASFILAFIFTYLRSKKTGTLMWGYTAKRVLLNVAVPMLIGGLFIWRLTYFGMYGLIAPACLLFYGLGLLNASKYAPPEVKYLGYAQLALGVISLWLTAYGLYFWALGFGVLHIIYGIIMWSRYERYQQEHHL